METISGPSENCDKSIVDLATIQIDHNHFHSEATDSVDQNRRRVSIKINDGGDFAHKKNGFQDSAEDNSRGKKSGADNQTGASGPFVDDLIDFGQPENIGAEMYQSDGQSCDNSSQPMYSADTHSADHNWSILDSPIAVSKEFSPTIGPKYLTTNALASHLFRGRPGGGSTRDASRRSSVGSDDLESISASDPGAIVVSPEELSELNSRMEKIQKQLEQQRETDDKYIRLKQENVVLKQKISLLEEQVLVNEDKWQSQLADNERKCRDLQAHADRERTLELEALTLRYRLLERDHEHCGGEREKIVTEIEQLRRRCQHLEEALSDSQQELEARENSRKTGEQKLWKEKDETEKRLRLALETCEDLRRDIDHLKNERGRVDVTATELEEELQRLKEEQKRLRETNDELHAELLHASVEHGRKLLADAPSLADEMGRMSKDQVMEALRDQEIVNKKLRAYVDGILLRILEMYPAILEIKPGEKGLDPF